MDIGTWFVDFWESTGITLIKTLAIIVFGILIIRIIMRYAKRALMASSLETGLSSFLLSVIRAVLYILLIFLALSTLGVSMAAFIAALSAAGLAIVLALKDSLSNLASGILILVNKPFVEGDYIQVGSEEGTVKSVRIFTTQIETYDKKVITLPNSSIVNGNVINYTSSPLRRVDINFCVPFGTAQQYVKEIVREAFKDNKIALKSPDLYISVDGYDEHGLLFAFRIWGKSEDYWALYEDAYEKLTDALYKAGIPITNNLNIISLSDEERSAMKAQFKEAYENRQKEKAEKEDKKSKAKKTKVEVIDADNAKGSSTVAVEYTEPTVLDSSVITSPSAMLSQPIDTESTKKKRRKLWGRKDEK